MARTARPTTLPALRVLELFAGSCSIGKAAPRGSKTGTQGLKGAHVRSVIPHELCLEVMRAAREQALNHQP